MSFSLFQRQGHVGDGSGQGVYWQCRCVGEGPQPLPHLSQCHHRRRFAFLLSFSILIFNSCSWSLILILAFIISLLRKCGGVNKESEILNIISLLPLLYERLVEFYKYTELVLVNSYGISFICSLNESFAEITFTLFVTWKLWGIGRNERYVSAHLDEDFIASVVCNEFKICHYSHVYWFPW